MLKFSKLFFIGFILILGFQGCSSDNDTQEPTVIIAPIDLIDSSEVFQYLNVPYGSDSDHVYDIYLPANRTLDTKIIVLVHGGGWTSGDKADMNSYKDIIRQELPDYAIVNINYRLASRGVSPFPMQLDDITKAIDHLKANQNEYVISNNYGLVGVSAGAHLSMLWSYNYDTNNDVNMVASIVGPTNLTDLAYTNNPQLQIDQLMLYFGVAPTTAFLESNSPYHQVEASSPPTILFYGGMDSLIPTSQGVDMNAKLTNIGVTHEFTLYPEEGHGWDGASLLDTWTKLKLFIETHH